MPQVTLSRVAGYRRSPRGDERRPIIRSTRTLRIRQTDGLNFSTALDLAAPARRYLNSVIFMRFRGPQALNDKLVKPGKVARSWGKGKTGFDQGLVIETEPKMGTAHAAVLGKADPAVSRELRSFDLADRRCDKTIEFPALFFRDRGLQVLDFRLMLAYEDDQSHIGNSRSSTNSRSTADRESASP